MGSSSMWEMPRRIDANCHVTDSDPDIGFSGSTGACRVCVRPVLERQFMRSDREPLATASGTGVSAPQTGVASAARVWLLS